MERYDYYEAVKEDVLNYIREHNIEVTEENRYEIATQLHDDCWAEDCVTGNASGSYTFNAWQAEENVCHNLDLLGEALNEFGCDASYIMDNGAEACDVTIRCYVLGSAIDEAINELLDED